MSRRRTCCCDEPASGYPCQDCPSSPKEWTLYVSATGIVNDSAGDGLLWGCLDFIYPDCTVFGACARQVYRRKAVGNTDFMEDICRDEICESIMDEAAPTMSGSHLIKWDFCPGVGDYFLCDYVYAPADFSVCNPNIEDVQDGAVRILAVVPNAHWNFTTCAPDNPEVNDECCTLIYVKYQYSDSFLMTRWDTVDGECVDSQVTMYPRSSSFGFSHEVEWNCIYGRRVGAGEFFAEGSYNLLKCEYPAAYRTYPIDYSETGYECSLPGGIACASSWKTSPNIPTTWQPPSSIDLIRSV